MTASREFIRIVDGMPASDGAGVSLLRVVGTPTLDFLDPFLMLDEFKNDDPGAYVAGFPEHPHRGFETVSYMKQGKMRHRDSVGNEGVIADGGVQWMTAGRGIIHSEMPEQSEGLLWGYQLWVNLPAEHKMVAPRYQDIQSDGIPEVSEDGVDVRIMAGDWRGTKGASQTLWPVGSLDVRVAPGRPSLMIFPRPLTRWPSSMKVRRSTAHAVPGSSVGDPQQRGRRRQHHCR